jgi:hypothetical protein
MQREVKHKTIEEMEAELTPEQYAWYKEKIEEMGPIVFPKN